MSFEFGETSVCRACGSSNLVRVLPLEDMPPGDKYSLDINNVPTQLLSSSIDMCQDCQHIQMSGWADPKYIYASYFSRPATINHALKSVYDEYSYDIGKLAGSGSVLEVGSNDGLFLSLLSELGIKCAGIEPASNMVTFANQRNVDTINDFVSKDSIQQAVEHIGRPAVILANHSFSNVLNIKEWTELLTDVLIDDGFLVLQTFYQKSVLDNFLLENYNHEHFTYAFITPLLRFFSGFGLKPISARFIDAKGGSIRLTLQKTNSFPVLDQSSTSLIEAEKPYLSNPLDYFQKTTNYIARTRSSIHNHISTSLPDKSSMCAYGTSIGATVFSYQFGLQDTISEFFDDDTLRQHTLSPGTATKVSPGRTTAINSYANCLILAPLYADKIIANNIQYSDHGGQFLKIRPEFSVYSNNH